MTMNDCHISKIALSGFKSIKTLDLTLTNLNVIVGANGSGKSNILSLFRLIQNAIDKKLQYYVSKNGGPNAFLHYGSQNTSSLTIEIFFGNNGYKMVLEPTVDKKFVFSEEAFWWNMGSGAYTPIGSGHFESLLEKGTGTGIDSFVVPAIKSWRLYHFHDTSDTALVKQLHGINDYELLRPDASNLAAYLLYLKKHSPNSYALIVETIRLVAPFFDDFVLRPYVDNKDQIELEWKERFNDVPLKSYMLSDGTLRFICLAVVFLQPEEKRPETIVVDEPELGLHPAAISVLAGMIRSASKSKQVIIATQSPDLLSEFEPENVIVTERRNGVSLFHRLQSDELKEWADEFSLGDLWKKNIFGGRPTR